MVEVCVKKYYRDVPSIRISEVELRRHPRRKKPPFSARAPTVRQRFFIYCSADNNVLDLALTMTH